MSPLEGFPPTAKSPVPLPGHQRGEIGENSGLCAGPPLLDREVQPAYPRPTHLLAGSILQLRAVMGPYVSFPIDAVLDSVAPPEGFQEDQPETTISRSAQ